MAKLPPPEHSRWKPGQSGNISGRPKAKLTVESLRQIIEKMAFLTRDGLQQVLTDGATPMIELQIASIMAQAAKTGDYSRMQFLLDRVLGKVADVRENINTEKARLKLLTNVELIEIVREEAPHLLLPEKVS